MISGTMKVALDPTASQAAMITKTLDCCGMLWNRMIADEAKLRAELGQRFIPTPAKYKRELPQLNEADYEALSGMRHRLLRQFQNHDYNPHDTSKPEPVAQMDSYFTRSKLAKGGFKIRFEDGGIRLPKLGLVPTGLHAELPAGAYIRSAIVEKSDGRFYCTVKYEYEQTTETVVAAVAAEQRPA